jgi:hypothetical protein
MSSSFGNFMAFVLFPLLLAHIIAMNFEFIYWEFHGILISLSLAQIQKVIVLNFKFIFEEFDGTLLILTVVGLNLS